MKIIMLGAQVLEKVLRQNRLHRRTIFHTSQQVIFSEQILKKEQSLEKRKHGIHGQRTVRSKDETICDLVVDHITR